MLKELYHFLLHLRLHYQLLILSGGYLLGGFMAGEMNTTQYWAQFLNVHVLLFGGATAYNSWWDKDTGPIGGLKNPPQMNRWMHPVSLLFMFVGLWFAMSVGWAFSALFFVSLILFWLYSTPLARWKSRPLLSLLAISISTGFNSVLMGTLAAGGAIALVTVLSAVGASLILLSLYPVSQIFQIEEDTRRRDQTFVLVYGVSGMKKFFLASFTTGAMLLGGSVLIFDTTAGTILLVGTAICGIVIARLIMRLKGISEEYGLVMKTKFLASLSFVVFFLAGNIIRHGWLS
jgi:1,4-dihydroxy-2-naphthoate octaprenyltransferase